jgi:hypothetical protein
MLPTSSRRGVGAHSATPLLLQDNLIVASSAGAEFLGTLLLQVLAASTSSPVWAAAVYAALCECGSGRPTHGLTQQGVKLPKGVSRLPAACMHAPQRRVRTLTRAPAPACPARTHPLPHCLQQLPALLATLAAI